MAAEGWYPDPSGVRGRYRYWDGSTWSDGTTTDPAQAPPPTAKAPKPGNRGWLVALGVLALVTVIAVVLLLATSGGLPGRGTPVKEDSNSDTPTVTGWDESSTPSTTPPPPPDTSGGVWVDCPQSTGMADTRQTPGRLTAGGFSFAVQPQYVVLPSNMNGLSIAYDAQVADRRVFNGGRDTLYVSTTAIGRVAIADGFVNLSTTAQRAMECWSMTQHPVEAPVEVLIAGEPMTISGHAAWHIRWHITYTREPIVGEILDIVTVDMGAQADYLGLFWCCRPYNDPDFDAAINAAIASLAVT